MMIQILTVGGRFAWLVHAFAVDSSVDRPEAHIDHPDPAGQHYGALRYLLEAWMNCFLGKEVWIF
jgi:hypothetical protein